MSKSTKKQDLVKLAQKVNKKIAEDNAKFKAMNAEEKRVAIACDVDRGIASRSEIYRGAGCARYACADRNCRASRRCGERAGCDVEVPGHAERAGGDRLCPGAGDLQVLVAGRDRYRLGRAAIFYGRGARDVLACGECRECGRAAELKSA